MIHSDPEALFLMVIIGVAVVIHIMIAVDLAKYYIRQYRERRDRRD